MPCDETTPLLQEYHHQPQASASALPAPPEDLVEKLKTLSTTAMASPAKQREEQSDATGPNNSNNRFDEFREAAMVKRATGRHTVAHLRIVSGSTQCRSATPTEENQTLSADQRQFEAAAMKRKSNKDLNQEDLRRLYNEFERFKRTTMRVDACRDELQEAFFQEREGSAYLWPKWSSTDQNLISRVLKEMDTQEDKENTVYKWFFETLAKKYALAQATKKAMFAVFRVPNLALSLDEDMAILELRMKAFCQCLLPSPPVVLRHDNKEANATLHVQEADGTVEANLSQFLMHVMPAHPILVMLDPNDPNTRHKANKKIADSFRLWSDFVATVPPTESWSAKVQVFTDRLRFRMNGEPFLNASETFPILWPKYDEYDDLHLATAKRDIQDRSSGGRIPHMYNWFEQKVGGKNSLSKSTINKLYAAFHEYLSKAGVKSERDVTAVSAFLGKFLESVGVPYYD